MDDCRKLGEATEEQIEYDSPRTPLSATGTDSAMPRRLKELASRSREKAQDKIGSGVREIAEKAWAMYDDEAIKRLEEQRQGRERKARTEQLWRDATVPDRHRLFIEEGTPMAPDRIEVGKLLKFCLGSGFIYGLWGKPDVGKTQVAVGLIRCVVVDGSPYKLSVAAAKYLHAASLFGALQKAIVDADIEAARAYYAAFPLLVIDEIGKTAVSSGSTSDFARQELELLLDKRSANLRDTLLLSNMTEASFRAELGTGPCSRMQQAGGFIHMDGPSFRGA